MENEDELSFKELVLNFKLKRNRLKEYSIRKFFPIEYINILNYSINVNSKITWLGKVYNYVNNLKEIPKCNICGNNLTVKYIQKGYSKCISASCPKNNINIDNFTKTELKEWFNVDNKCGYKSTEKYLSKHYPKLYQKILNNSNENNINFLTKIYLYLFDMTESPRCKCGVKCKFIRHLKNGFHKCCHKCSPLNSREFNAKNDPRLKYNSFSDFIIKNYKNGMTSNECYIKKSNPIEYEEIISYSLNLNNNFSWRQKLYNYIYKIEKVPICLSCKNTVKYNNFMCGYRKFCSHECLSRYNGIKFMRNNFEAFKLKAKVTLLKKYSVEYPSQNKEIMKRILNTTIERYGEIYKKHIPSYNPNSIAFLDQISERLGLPIQHALNGGEKKFVRYWADGYIEPYNICIEWDERYHKSKKQIDSDNIRETYLKEKHNCHIIRVNEQEFLKDIDNQINIIVDKIKNIINNCT